MLGRILIILLLAASSAHASDVIDWSYDGRNGPAHWGELHAGYATCASGMQQSPIDFVDAYDTYLTAPDLNWATTGWQVEHSGQTLVMHNDSGGTATLDDHEFDLIQVHLHAQSEHTFAGRHFPMEVQFMHRDDDGNFLIISVMIRGGGRHDDFNAIVAALPEKKGQANPLRKVDLSTLISDLGDAFRYQGSLTQPPCAENVTWIVMTDPITVGREALQAFTYAFPNSRRPVQPLNRRIVLTD